MVERIFFRVILGECHSSWVTLFMVQNAMMKVASEVLIQISWHQYEDEVEDKGGTNSPLKSNQFHG